MEAVLVSSISVLCETCPLRIEEGWLELQLTAWSWREASLCSLTVKTFIYQSHFHIDLQKEEVLELAQAALEVEGSRVGEAYLQKKQDKKNRLNYFLGGAQLSLGGTGRKSKRMNEWVQAIKGRKDVPPKVVERKAKEMVTKLHFKGGKPVKAGPYLLKGGDESIPS